MIGHSQAILLSPQDAENYDSRGSVYRSLSQYERADLDFAKPRNSALTFDHLGYTAPRGRLV